MLKGIGATIALPFLDAMRPSAYSIRRSLGEGGPKLICIEQVHGAAGSTIFGQQQNLWSPAAV